MVFAAHVLMPTSVLSQGMWSYQRQCSLNGGLRSRDVGDLQLWKEECKLS